MQLLDNVYLYNIDDLERLVAANVRLREQELGDRLRHQLAFTSAITNNLGEGVLALDRAGQITFANPAAGRN